MRLGIYYNAYFDRIIIIIVCNLISMCLCVRVKVEKNFGDKVPLSVKIALVLKATH